ncbi:helix-turn-helix domain-containing protein [Streptomyces sp. NPDC017529]|uniref:helix-turn-helix domain-containing protein n=1 Tax=Streptomyces sp. NPDC017529 TaxID=3365000 RepID=UPI0037B4D07D
MPGYFPPATCENCGELLKEQSAGRPGKYCDTQCRQAAYRKRQQGLVDVDTSDLDGKLADQMEILEEKIMCLPQLLTAPGARPELFLESLVQIQLLAEKMVTPAVQRARRHGTDWATIGTLVRLNKDTARHKYGEGCDRPAPRAPRPRPATPPSAGDDTSGSKQSRPLGTEPPPPASLEPPGPPGQLAPVLSKLQRASQLSLRSLGDATRLSSSYLSRVMSGERFPSWDATARLARACGADPAALRKVWEDAQARRTTRRTGHTLASALRYLHRRAGSPTPWAMAVTSGGTLDQHQVAAVLDGSDVPDWEIVQRIVMVLDGVPDYFAPLWESALTHQPAPETEPETAAQAGAEPPPHPAPAPPPTRQLDDLLGAFSNTLTAPLQHLTTSEAGRPPGPLPPPAPGSAVHRRPRPAPIPALTHWTAR